MPTESNNIIIRCPNPECAKSIRLTLPNQPGIYPVTCPHCNTTKYIRLKEGSESNSKTQNQDATTERTNQVPDNSNKPVIELSDDFITGEDYKLICPHCRHNEIQLDSSKPGHKQIVCPHCRGRIGADIRSETEVVSFYETEPIIKGKLVLLRKGWLNKSFKLAEGSVTIGRQDKSQPSDITIPNDSSISRRSIRIDVTLTEKGYSFKLTVLKATNPVLHNNKPLLIGESISLNFGDSITLGKTKLRFEKDI